MKLAIRAFIFHVICITLFYYVYNSMSEHFVVKNNLKKTKFDFLLLSTTLQAGVGMTNLHPLTDLPKIAMMIQQMVMLFTNVIILYAFTL